MAGSMLKIQTFCRNPDAFFAPWLRAPGSGPFPSGPFPSGPRAPGSRPFPSGLRAPGPGLLP